MNAMIQHQKIKLLVTGGTIDKTYNALNGELIFTQTQLPQMLEQSRCHADISLETILLKDSLDMNDADRKKIVQTCLACEESLIIITHGTDTMTLTAHSLSTQIKDKTVVLLGAMIPYAFKQSDSLFNLGTAIAAVQCLPSGIYITMNGKVFNWNNVAKNKQKGVFE
jgi:L-asparaginase